MAHALSFSLLAGHGRYNTGTRGALHTLRVWADTARQRRALAELDDARLSDLGLTRAEARAEAQRPFWDCAA